MWLSVIDEFPLVNLAHSRLHSHPSDSIQPLAKGIQKSSIFGIGDRIDERHRLRLHVGIHVPEGKQTGVRKRLDIACAVETAHDVRLNGDGCFACVDHRTMSFFISAGFRMTMLSTAAVTTRHLDRSGAHRPERCFRPPCQASPIPCRSGCC